MPRSMLNTSGPTLGSPRWAGDYMGREQLIPGGAMVDPAQFVGGSTGTRVTLTANAAAAAVSLTVTAITNPIPAGTVLNFGTTKFARTSAAVAAGVTVIPVDATPTAMVIGDTAVYPGLGKKSLPSGSIVGRTRAEAAAGTPFGAPADTDEEFFLTAFDIFDIDAISEIELYRPGCVVYENFLPPDFAASSATVKAAIRLRYLCTVGQV